MEEEYAPSKRSHKDIISLIEAHLRPAFGLLLLKQISPLHVQRYVTAHRHLAKKTVANHLIQLRAMMREAGEIGWLERVPKIKIPKCRRDETDYRYLKSDDEIRRFLLAAKEESEDAYDFYKTAIYTGARAGELAALQPSDIDLKNGFITLQRGFDGPTKGGDIRRVPIFDVLRRDLARRLLRLSGSPLVFPNQVGRMHAPSARIFQETLHRVLDKAKFPSSTQNGKTRRYITFHCLRHTFASHYMMRGGDLYKLQKLLGHKSIEMTQRYAHLAPHAFAGEHDRFGDGREPEGELITLPEAIGHISGTGG